MSGARGRRRDDPPGTLVRGLTDRGERIALDVVKRHTTLSAFLHKVLGLPDTDADEGACLMERAVRD